MCVRQRVVIKTPKNAECFFGIYWIAVAPYPQLLVWAQELMVNWIKKQTDVYSNSSWEHLSLGQLPADAACMAAPKISQQVFLVLC